MDFSCVLYFPVTEVSVALFVRLRDVQRKLECSSGELKESDGGEVVTRDARPFGIDQESYDS